MGNTAFSDNQFEHIYPDGIENHYWNHARNHIILDFIRKKGLSDHVMLEVGGGRGIVTRFLHEHGISCTGVELAHVKPVEGTTAYFQTGKDAFDLDENTKKQVTMILLFDVLEHIERPVLFLERITAEFSNVRYILVTVPAGPELWTNYDTYNGHFRRYTMNDLKTMGNQRILFQKGSFFNHILYPVFLVYSKVVKQRSTDIKAPKGLQIYIHKFLSWILRLEYQALPGKWKGTSIIALFTIK